MGNREDEKADIMRSPASTGKPTWEATAGGYGPR